MGGFSLLCADAPREEEGEGPSGGQAPIGGRATWPCLNLLELSRVAGAEPWGNLAGHP